VRKLTTVAAAAVCLVSFLAAQPRAQKDDDDKNEPKRVRDISAVRAFL